MGIEGTEPEFAEQFLHFSPLGTSSTLGKQLSKLEVEGRQPFAGVAVAGNQELSRPQAVDERPCRRREYSRHLSDAALEGSNQFEVGDRVEDRPTRAGIRGLLKLPPKGGNEGRLLGSIQVGDGRQASLGVALIQFQQQAGGALQRDRGEKLDQPMQLILRPSLKDVGDLPTEVPVDAPILRVSLPVTCHERSYFDGPTSRAHKASLGSAGNLSFAQVIIRDWRLIGSENGMEDPSEFLPLSSRVNLLPS